MTAAHTRRVRHRRASRVAFTLATSALAVLALQAPAAASNDPSYSVQSLSCHGNEPGSTHYGCERYTEAWQTNSPTPNALGTRGLRQQMWTYYSPNNTRPSHDIEVRSSTSLWEIRNTNWTRMRLTQTFKALNTSGASVSVGWGGVGIGFGGDQVTESQVFLSMTRRAPLASNVIGRSATLSFAHNYRVERVEQVSSGTIEYTANNRSYRVISQARLTDY